MVFVTGDKHGQLEPFLHNKSLKKIKKNDVLIVCGDFGFLWDGSSQEQKNLRWLSKRKYVIAFVEGCNDNGKIIKEHPISEWNGGNVRIISKNIIYLMQGETYKIQDKKILTFGGGFNPNILVEEQENNWWPEQFSNKQGVDLAIKNIEKNAGDFDAIISHEAPASITPCLEDGVKRKDAINYILEQIRVHCNFKKWFFGKYHLDKLIPPFYHAVFEDVIKI